ncbi:MAG: RNB domain-containing ribonuclease, partial [Anaeroplasmataceae bacterium]
MEQSEKVLNALLTPYCHSVEQVNKITNISMKQINEIIEELIKEDKIHKVRKDFYAVKKIGILDVKKTGFGFIMVDGEESDYFVPSNDLKTAYNKDKVSFYVLPKSGNQKLDTGIIIDIVERSNNHVFGKVTEVNKKGKTTYYVVSHDKKYDTKAIVDYKDLNGAVTNSIVVADIIDHSGVYPKVVISRVVGHTDDPGVDISLIALQFGFNTEFPEDCMDQALKVETEFEVSKYPNRTDFTNDVVITIDGDDSKDFDDAVSVVINSDGNYLLNVHIADVSEYVTFDSPLDIEAYNRGTSVYLA